MNGDGRNEPVAGALARAVQERELARLRGEVQIGLAELDAGLGEEIDIKDVIRQARQTRG